MDFGNRFRLLINEVEAVKTGTADAQAARRSSRVEMQSEFRRCMHCMIYCRRRASHWLQPGCYTEMLEDFAAMPALKWSSLTLTRKSANSNRNSLERLRLRFEERLGFLIRQTVPE